MNGYRGGLPYTYYSQMGRQATPGYNPFSKSPDWASAIREALKNMQMMKQMKEGREQQQWERSIRERETKALEDYRRSQLQPKKPTVPTKIQIARIIAEETGESEGEVLNRLEIGASGKAPKPTQFDMTKAWWDKEVAAGRKTPEQRSEALYKVKPKPTPEEVIKKGATTRQTNANFVRDTLNKAEVGRILKDAKKAKVPPVVNGIRFDMPFSYNAAILNKQDRVETPEDLDTIAKYDAMYRVFQLRLLGQGIDTFDKFMKLDETKDLRKDPDFDNGQIKIWYDIYRKY